MTMLKYLLFLIIHTCYINYSIAQSLNCNIDNNLPPSADEKLSIMEGILTITYDREEVGIYKYNNTNLVNILLNNVQVTFNGSLNSKSNPSNFKIAPSFPTLVEGIAVLANNDTLEDCELQIETNPKYSEDLSPAVQEKIFYLAKSCIEPKLCNAIGRLEREDFAYAKISPHEFGDKSVLYILMGEKFPNLSIQNTVSDSSNPCDNQPLQKSLNILVDFLLADIISLVSGPELGIVILPEVHEVIPGLKIIRDGEFHMTNGTLGNLKNILRVENVIVSNDGLRFSIKSGFQLPNVKIQFKDKTNYFVVNQNGLTTINIDSIMLSIKITINFNQSPCRSSLDYVRSSIEGVHSDIDGGLRIASFITNKLVNTYIKNIVSFLKLKLKIAFSTLLENFDCERYRP